MAENKVTPSVLDLLLRAELPDMRRILPQKQVEVPRLSQLAGSPVIFTVRGLTWREASEVQSRTDGRLLHIVLTGCVEPDWRSGELLDASKGVATPLDAIEAKLLPGEIEDLAIEIQQLSGYLRRTVTDVKNA